MSNQLEAEAMFLTFLGLCGALVHVGGDDPHVEVGPVDDPLDKLRHQRVLDELDDPGGPSEAGVHVLGLFHLSGITNA